MPDGSPIARPLSLTEIASVLGVSRQLVQQIERAALAKLIAGIGLTHTLPTNWWRAAMATPRRERDEERYARSEMSLRPRNKFARAA